MNTYAKGTPGIALRRDIADTTPTNSEPRNQTMNIDKYNAILASAYNADIAEEVRAGLAATPATIDALVSRGDRIFLLNKYRNNAMKEKRPLFSVADISKALEYSLTLNHRNQPQ